MRKAGVILLLLLSLHCQARTLLKQWSMESSLKTAGSPSELSSAGYDDALWHRVNLPSTVLSALVKEGVYPDPRIGLNNYLIPDVSDSFNARVGIEGENLWKDPWWFRTEFTLDKELKDKKIAWLCLDGINYRADIWLNGRLVAGKEEVVGMFRRFRFNVSSFLRSGTNAIAIKIYQVDHPGTPTPGTQLILFGPNRGNAGDIFRDETLKFSGGWDCAPVVRDRNMGIWQDVWLEGTDLVSIEDPYVHCEVPSDRLARVSVSALVRNNGGKTVRGTFTARVSHLDSLDMGSWIKYTPGTFKPLELSAQVVLKPGESRRVAFYPKEIDSPLLWWPVGYGEQHLHHIEMDFVSGGKVSDTKGFDFGIREVSKELLDHGGEKGLVFRINGRRIFCRGGWLQPDMMLDNSRANIFNQARLLAEAGVNLVGSEDMPAPQEDWLESWDRYGIMDWHVFHQCYRMYPGRANAHNPDDHALAVECVKDELYRYRNHPSIVAWFAVNEVMVDEDIYVPTKEAAATIDPSRPFFPTTSVSWDVERLTPWIKDDLPTGTTDDGAPDYGWAPSRYYFDKVEEVYLQMFRNEMGMPGMPVYQSLEKFIPSLGKPFKASDRLFPLDSIWAEHGAWDANNYCYRGYDNAIRTLYGDPLSAKDYVRKGEMVSAEGYRAMIEAANHRMWDITTGVMLWKLNSCWPDVCWQLYDWYLEPGAAYWFARKAMEQVHIQLNAGSDIVCVTNATWQDLEGLTASVSLVGTDMKEYWKWEGPVKVARESWTDLVKVPLPWENVPVYLVRLTLRDASGGIISENLYWKYTQHESYAALMYLPKVDILDGVSISVEGREAVVTLSLRNSSSTLSFFNHLGLECEGERISPVFWSDNFISLFPGEEKVVQGRFPTEYAKGGINVVID